MGKPTKKQLNFIKVIEEEWKQNPFSGTTKKEATEYISQAIKEKERYDFENEAMGLGLPNQQEETEMKDLEWLKKEFH